MFENYRIRIICHSDQNAVEGRISIFRQVMRYSSYEILKPTTPSEKISLSLHTLGEASYSNLAKIKESRFNQVVLMTLAQIQN